MVVFIGFYAQAYDCTAKGAAQRHFPPIRPTWAEYASRYNVPQRQSIASEEHAGESARVARRCDATLSAAYEEFFAPLGEKLRADLLSGSLVTTAHLGVTRMEDNSYFAQYSVLIGFLRNEQYLMNTTRKFGLGMGEYRVLLALYEHPSMDRPGALRSFLAAHKSELSGWCKSLEAKGLVFSAAANLDRRGKTRRLTAAGAKLVEDVHDAMSLREVRPIQPGEISLYNGMFHIIMDDIRQA